MYDIIFYKDKNNHSGIIEMLDNLQEQAKTNKDARINREKILSYMTALAEFGTRIGKPIVKHIDGNIWELRPLSNRIFFFYWKENTFVLLHHYIKKSQKAPVKEINKARLNLKDFFGKEW